MELPFFSIAFLLKGSILQTPVTDFNSYRNDEKSVYYHLLPLKQAVC